MSRNSKRIRRVRLALLEINATCRYCGEEIGRRGRPAATVDHIDPISDRGGVNDLSNMTLCCIHCNKSKRDRTPERWAADILSRLAAIRAESATLAESRLPAFEAVTNQVPRKRSPASGAKREVRWSRWNEGLERNRRRRRIVRRARRLAFAAAVACVSLMLFVLNPALPASRSR